MEFGHLAFHGLVGLGAMYATFSCIQRYHFRKFVRLATYMKADPEWNEGDRLWLRYTFTRVQSKNVVSLSDIPRLFIASFTIIYRLLMIARKGQFAEMKALHAQDLAEHLNKVEAKDPRIGRWWGSRENSDLLYHAQSFSIGISFPMFLLLYLVLLPGTIFGIVTAPFIVGAKAMSFGFMRDIFRLSQGTLDSYRTAIH